MKNNTTFKHGKYPEKYVKLLLYKLYIKIILSMYDEQTHLMLNLKPW